MAHGYILHSSVGPSTDMGWAHRSGLVLLEAPYKEGKLPLPPGFESYAARWEAERKEAQRAAAAATALAAALKQREAEEATWFARWQQMAKHEPDLLHYLAAKGVLTDALCRRLEAAALKQREEAAALKQHVEEAAALKQQEAVAAAQQRCLEEAAQQEALAATAALKEQEEAATLKQRQTIMAWLFCALVAALLSWVVAGTKPTLLLPWVAAGHTPLLLPS
jgi:hypothetical protein